MTPTTELPAALTTTSCRLLGRLVVDTPWLGRWMESRFWRGPPTLLLRVRDVLRFSACLSNRPRGSEITGSGTRLWKYKELKKQKTIHKEIWGGYGTHMDTLSLCSSSITAVLLASQSLSSKWEFNCYRSDVISLLRGKNSYMNNSSSKMTACYIEVVVWDKTVTKLACLIFRQEALHYMTWSLGRYDASAHAHS